MAKSKVKSSRMAEKILVVEDEALIRDMVTVALGDEGYETVAVADGRSGWELLKEGNSNFDLVILDLMLPQINGLDLCRMLRQNNNGVPILMLSARGTETDRVVGLEIGADDYLTKPFGMRELIARCRALIRRQNQQGSRNSLTHEDISLYPEECRVTVGEKELNLSPKEFRLLELFMSHPKRVWSRESLLEKIWGHDFVGDSKTVDVHIRWLREKLEVDPSHPKYLVTIRGFGYRFG
jgi:two-component system, OmpR family, phosphate regulon response regulator PhoB